VIFQRRNKAKVLYLAAGILVSVDSFKKFDDESVSLRIDLCKDTEDLVDLERAAYRVLSNPKFVSENTFQWILRFFSEVLIERIPNYTLDLLSDRKTNILLNLVKIFGWDKIYESILQKSFEASLKSSLKSSISFAFFLLKDFEISNSEHVQILLKLCFNQVIEELKSLHGIDSLRN
jgi:hypothetical protein